MLDQTRIPGGTQRTPIEAGPNLLVEKDFLGGGWS